MHTRINKMTTIFEMFTMYVCVLNGGAWREYKNFPRVVLFGYTIMCTASLQTNQTLHLRNNVSYIYLKPTFPPGHRC